MSHLIQGIHALERPYKGLVVDLWGVMHNGKALFTEAVAALTVAKAAGQSVTLLSNAPRRRTAALANLDRLGLSRRLFDNLITSGEVAWQALNGGAVAAWGSEVFFFGAAQDQEMKQALKGMRFVETLNEAAWILNVGPEAGQIDTSPFQGFLDAALARNLPMVCANPDLIVRRGSRIEICAGAVAQAYEAAGGKVVWFGKPHGQVYQAVFDSCGLKASELLAVGDSFKTDVLGAQRQGLDVLYVNSGIHGTVVGHPLKMDKIALLAAEVGAAPTYVAEAFRP